MTPHARFLRQKNHCPDDSFFCPMAVFFVQFRMIKKSPTLAQVSSGCAPSSLGKGEINEKHDAIGSSARCRFVFDGGGIDFVGGW
jgi:hypothetical protein